jgi:glutathione-regulated potassium-efflux system ancillary protein KefG
MANAKNLAASKVINGGVEHQPFRGHQRSQTRNRHLRFAIFDLSSALGRQPSSVHNGAFMAGRILINFAHPAPKKSRVNRRLIAAVRDLEGVTINDLYEEYPDFYISVPREQELLLAHDIIVFQHPFYWYSHPALLKEWQDLVLEYGFAYGHKGTRLQNKDYLCALSTGGPKESYTRDGNNYFTVREFLAPTEQTARLCGMRFLPPFIVYGALRLETAEEIEEYAKLYRSIILGLRDGSIGEQELTGLTELNEVFNQQAQPPALPVLQT